MSPIEIAFVVEGAVWCAALGLLTASSVRDHRRRATHRALLVLATFGVVWFGMVFVLGPPTWVLAVLGLVVAVPALLYILPFGSISRLGVGSIRARVDERDVMFAREEYRSGTDKYRTYYAMRPEHRAVDDKLRQLPELLAPGGRFYDAVESREIDVMFDAIRGIAAQVDGSVNPRRIAVDPASMTAAIRNLTRRLGADEVGAARLNPMWVYSHVGRGPEPWGTPIENTHAFAIMFTLEMDYQSVEAAPRLAITRETALQYMRGAWISVALAAYIRSLGYPARAHIAGSNYQIMMVPVAQDAGLGELGRIGYLISPRFGARIRLGGVTTDLPLALDSPIAFGVQDFCSSCLKCARNCPSGAISKRDKTNVRGVEKWPLAMERCLHYWRVIGTDCGLCMKVCPYSHPPALLHNFVRASIRHSAFARNVSVWGDDFFYGRKMSFPPWPGL